MLWKIETKCLAIMIFIIVLNLGCPVLTTMETAKIGSKALEEDHFKVGDIKQIDFFGTITTDTLDKRTIYPYLIEGKLKWIVLDERLEFGVNCGTSGFGLSSKLLLIKKPIYLALKGGASGFPWIFLTNPSGGYYGDLIASHDVGKTSEVYAGCKYIFWVRSSNIESREEFGAFGGFTGFKLKSVFFEAGVYKVLTEGDDHNPWSVNGYIPVFGVSFVSLVD